MTQTSKKSIHHLLSSKQTILETSWQSPDSMKQKVGERSGSGEQRRAKPTGQTNGRPIDTMQKCEETSMKLRKQIREKTSVHFIIRTCKIHGKYYYPFQLHKKCSSMHLHDLISVQIANGVSILPGVEGEF
jgi:hypothetical protein